MSKRESPALRDDNLRLVLSSHESGYIESGLHEARAGLRQLLTVGGGALLAVIVMSALAIYTDIPRSLIIVIVIAMVFAVVTILVCAVNAVGAYFSLRRFRSYRNDHEKFLKHYRRSV